MTTQSYTCADSERDMDFYFEKAIEFAHQGKYVPPSEAHQALERALSHMTEGSTVGNHHIACQKCWDRYIDLKRAHCHG